MMAARSDVQWERLFVTEDITAREDLISSGQTPQPLVRLHHTHRYCTQYSDPSFAGSLHMKPGSAQLGSSNFQMQRSHLHHHRHSVTDK